MSNLTSPCLSGLETSQTAKSFIDVIVCPYKTAFTIPAIESIAGESFFYFLIGAGTLAMVYQRTQSFAFTAIVMLIAGTSLMALFPAKIVQLAVGMAALALAGLMVRVFSEKR